MTARGQALAGFTVAITADRRREEFAALLERRGARTVCAPALRIAPVADDASLYAVTAALIAGPPDVLIASTGIGMRSWIEVADGWNLAEPLLAALGEAYVIARGPKARGAVRAAGLCDAWSPVGECSDEVLAHLIGRGVRGRRIAVQLYGDDQPAFVSALRNAGAEVVEVEVYRWAPPADGTPIRRLIASIIARQVDAVAFTSAPAAAALLDTAGSSRRRMVDALRSDVLAACVGPVSARPLTEFGIPVVAPERARLGALARVVVEALPLHRPMLPVAGVDIELRGHAVVVDGDVRPLGPSPLSVLRVLAGARGRVCSRAELLAALPRGADEHAVEMAVNRLRAALGRPGLVETVVKRGYRLAIDQAR